MSVESDRKLESEPETSNENKKGKPESELGSSNIMIKWKTRVWKTRIFKETIGFNTSVESDRKLESEPETSNENKKGKPSRNPDLQK